MKKYLMMAVAGLAIASCSKMDGVTTQSEITKAKYDYAFKNYIGGNPAPDQTWGFSDDAYSNAPAFDFTRSASSPAVADIDVPFTASELATLLANAKEVTTATATQNWSGSADFAVEMKITGTWDGGITVAASEDWGSGDTPETGRAHRNIYVTGTWNIPDGQKIGGKGMIVIADGGTVNVASGKTLEMVNEARLVVLPGGTLTGAGMVIVNNGNATGEENYNGGTIDVATFNNNFGKFYNYGKFLVNEYQGGAKESNFYNHSLAAIDHFGGSTANARIFNACQFYVRHDARIRNYEGINGSALVVDGQLMFSSSEDGTNDPTYVGLAGGALIKCATLYNNGTSWSGPTGTEYAALEITDKIVYLNWEQDHPENGGYFENNIYVKAGTWSNVPTGNGWQAGETSTADYKFFQIVANCRGNNGVKKVTEGTTEFIPKSDDFVKGESGCTPGFTADVPPIIPDTEYDIRIIAEDLSAQGASDFDFNDVVLDVKFGSKAQILLTHAGGILPLCIGVKDLAHEVHNLFGVWKGEFPTQDNATVERQEMVNTGAGPSKAAVDITDVMNVAIADAAAANTQLRLYVYKDGTWQEMQAPKGEPACKLAVDENFVVLPERRSIKGTYPLFVTWATTEGFSSKWW